MTVVHSPGETVKAGEPQPFWERQACQAVGAEPHCELSVLSLCGSKAYGIVQPAKRHNVSFKYLLFEGSVHA